MEENIKELQELIQNNQIQDSVLEEFISKKALSENEKEIILKYLEKNNVEIVFDINSLDDTIYENSFYSSLKDIPVLDNKTTRKLIEEYKKTQNIEIRNKIVEHNLRYVIYIIRRKYSQYMDKFDDLFQEGVEGLIKAIEKFDLKKNTHLSTYAYHWITQRINKYLSENSLIRTPQHITRLKTSINNTYQKIIEKKGDLPTSDEIAKELNVPTYKVETLLTNNDKNIVSLELVITNEKSGKETYLKDMIKDESIDIEQSIEKKELYEELRRCVNSLPERERFIIIHRFGLEGDPMSLEEIGQQLGLTRERVRQLLHKALRKLRHPSKSKNLRMLMK